jgi:4'-phosphopantetheinyl transferase EntD
MTYFLLFTPHSMSIVPTPFQGIRLAALQYEPDDLLRLKELARPVLKPGAVLPEKSSLGRQTEFYAGRAALAFAFQEIGFEAVVVPNPWFGFLTAHPDNGIFINLSHTRGFAVAALAHHPIGVDVEALGRDTSRALRKVATKEELEMIAGLDFKVGTKAVAPGVALWSAKEAISKAVGLGIKFGMQAFNPDLTQSAPCPVSLKLTGPLPLKNPAVAFHVHAGFLIAVCSKKEDLLPGIQLSTVAK